MHFQKIHIEISNICNLQCSFCPPVERKKKIMALGDFQKVVSQVAPYCDEIALHLMGEPLGHPNFPEIIKTCAQYGKPVNLVTNGTLLAKRESDLFDPIIRQINFSLHSYPDNFPDQDPEPYLRKIIGFSRAVKKERPELFINYRLWNLQAPLASREQNEKMLAILEGEFAVSLQNLPDVRQQKGIRLAERIILHFDTEFHWPSMLDAPIANTGYCYGMKSHIGILAEGTVVPCCLDKEAVIPLGNCLETSLDEILLSDRAQAIRRGFQERKLVEPLCQRCQYIQRFNGAKNPSGEISNE